MIQAFRSPSNGPTFDCGPLRLIVAGDAGDAGAVIERALGLYRGGAVPLAYTVRIEVRSGTCCDRAADGAYLRCARMAVERSPATWFASTPSGICAHARDVDDWRLSFPPLRFDEPEIGDVEDILSLILTENWRFAGWLPIHAGCVVAPNGAAALLCAASGGGKSTLTAALIRAGWKTLGDDKLLLRTKPMPLAASLAASFNLDPATARWFPELAGVADLPRYSAWTNKRRVMVGDFWPGALIDTIAPSHIISIVRDDGAGFHIRKLGAREALRVLFDQVVVANDRQVAREIAQTLAQLAADASAFELRLGRDAYSAHSIAGCLEAALA